MRNRKRKRSSFFTAAECSNWMIRSEGFRDSARMRPQDFTRNRKLPFTDLVFFMLNLVRSSTQTSLNRYFETAGREDVHMSQQSFSEARLKIRWEAFRDLFRMIVDLIYNGYYETWHGYRVSAIDGTKLQLPDDKDLSEQFGTMGRDNSAATAQGSALYDVLNKALIDVRIVPLEVGERELAMRHIDRLCQLDSFDKELLLFDRGYASFEMVKTMKERGISFVMRVKSGFNNMIDMLKEGDHVATLQKRGYGDITVRVLKFALPTGEIESLITDIANKSFDTDDFKALYFMRWPVETKYDEIKNKLEVENFSGRTPDAIRQDFYVTMYLSNMASIAYWEAQKDVETTREGKANKYSYHVNVSEEIGTLKDRFIEVLLEPSKRARIKKTRRILYLVAMSVAPSRPDRSHPRNPSPRKAKFRHNRKSNC